MKAQHGMIALVVIAACLAASAVAAQEVDSKIKKLDGYVDFQSMKLFEGKDAKIEVFLKEPMLTLVSKFLKSEDEELFNILSKLKLVRVQVFEVDDKMVKEFTEVTKTTAAMLDKKGWERIVRVREDDQNVDIHILPSKDYESVMGIVVMVAEDGEAVFVNIVGEINPEDIHRLGEHFDIDELHDIHIEGKKHKEGTDKD